MTFTPEQAEEIKKQLILQVEKIPNANKEQIKAYIEQLDEEGLEEFLKKNNIKISESGDLAQEKGEGSKESPASQCVFCSIAKGEIPSHKLAENKSSIAVLEINPLSKGHSLVIPREHLSIEKLPKTSMSLAQKIAKKIKKKLKSDDIKIETSSFQGHAMVNVIPIYKDTPLKKTKAEEKELEKLKYKLETKTRSKRKSSQTAKDDLKIPKLEMKIP